MADADLRHIGTEKEISQPRQQLIKVNDQLRTGFFYALPDIAHALEVFRKLQQIIRHTPGEIRPLVGMRRQKVRTRKLPDGSMHGTDEESRQTPRLAFSDQHFNHLVPVAFQQLFHCYSLSKMSSALTLNNKQYFHEAIDIKGNTFSCSLSSSGGTAPARSE